MRAYTLLGTTARGVRAISGNVSFLATIVASLVARRLGTFRRDVAHVAAVEAATVLRTPAFHHFASFSLETRVGTFACNMPLVR